MLASNVRSAGLLKSAGLVSDHAEGTRRIDPTGDPRVAPRTCCGKSDYIELFALGRMQPDGRI